jgi:hypothetical protein
MSGLRFDNGAADQWPEDALSFLACAKEDIIPAADDAAARLRQTEIPLNDQRAEIVLALAYLKTGNAERALHHALQGLLLSDQNAATQTVLDEAMALAAAAKAQNLTGNGGEAFRLIMLALAKADELAAEDRALFDKLFGES